MLLNEQLMLLGERIGVPLVQRGGAGRFPRELPVELRQLLVIAAATRRSHSSARGGGAVFCEWEQAPFSVLSDACMSVPTSEPIVACVYLLRIFSVWRLFSLFCVRLYSCWMFVCILPARALHFCVLESARPH